MFKIIKEDTTTQARRGELTTAHGVVETPAFFPVATQGVVKGLGVRDLEEIGVQGLLTNVYHLLLRPGIEVVKNCGGLHKFMGFNRTIITDSGGYQIFSLESLRKISDEGVKFQSHIDGCTFFLSPVDVIQAELDLGADIVVPLDECVKYPAGYDHALRATQRTVKWAEISKDYFIKRRKDNLFFGIIQGATYPDLRDYCYQKLAELNVDGFAIGGLSVGEPKDLRYNILSFLTKILAGDKVRYFMGYGKPQDIVEAVGMGIDLFDCVVPTRFARTGTAFTDEGKIVVRNAPYIEDTKPIDEHCRCYVCKRFSRAYLRHLINANEIMAAVLLTYHNIFWYVRFMERIRTAITQGNFESFRKEVLSKFKDV